MEQHTVNTPLGPVLVIVWPTGVLVRAGGNDADPVVVNRVPLRFRLDVDLAGTVKHISAERNEYDVNRGYNGNHASYAAQRKILDTVPAAIVEWLHTDEGREALGNAQADQRRKDLDAARATVSRLETELADARDALAKLEGGVA